ncbi:putative SOS response-associated peptidase YedK [Methanocalculus alkaliphilus]|uniref:SOS response-associated peptidase n=1 Tax=Methanocalculus alkaliphilus TaxID=768730 RepID=UPI00209E9D91|nr:SOS response-associated peptidase family protein [Methanocalculus alkaliphilus]MCP1714395.1 putative SOS response-associated peptidase YedK [Methanocalculus alkaliphilus]
MCSRYTIIGTRLLAEQFGGPVLPPRYNCAPGQRLPVVTTDLTIHKAVFGLPRQDGGRQINARIERIFERSYSRRRRCLVPMSGFYEWTPVGSVREPWYISSPDTPLLYAAGLTTGDFFLIITCPAVPPVQAIHQRMPLLLPIDAGITFLSGGDPVRIDPPLQIIRVGIAINHPDALDDPSLITPPDRHHWW